MKASDLAVWVNDALGLVQEDFYSTRTMITWLHKCGFKVKKDISTSKGRGCAPTYVVFSLVHFWQQYSLL